MCLSQILKYTATYLLILCSLNSCSKEKVLPRSGFPDKGEIFVCAYINNTKDNALSIFGKNLPEQNIQAFLDTGKGYYAIPLVYKAKTFQYDCNLSNTRFRPGITYKFKVVSNVLQDTIEFEKQLPDSFNIITNLIFPTKQEYNLNIRLSDNSLKRENYVFDRTSGGIGNRYFSKYLPYIRDFPAASTDFDELCQYNNLNPYKGFRLPFGISPENSPCDFLPLNQSFRYELTRFSREDYEYINSMYDNVDNYGNPFFLSYQVKNISQSTNGKLYGKVVSAYVVPTPQIVTTDYSDTLLRIFIKDKSGNDIIGDRKYYIEWANEAGDLRTNLINGNHYSFTENTIISRGVCGFTGQPIKEAMFKFNVRGPAGARYSTNTITIAITDDTQDFVLTLQ